MSVIMPIKYKSAMPEPKYKMATKIELGTLVLPCHTIRHPGPKFAIAVTTNHPHPIITFTTTTTTGIPSAVYQTKPISNEYLEVDSLVEAYKCPKEDSILVLIRRDPYTNRMLLEVNFNSPSLSGAFAPPWSTNTYTHYTSAPQLYPITKRQLDIYTTLKNTEPTQSMIMAQLSMLGMVKLSATEDINIWPPVRYNVEETQFNTENYTKSIKLSVHEILAFSTKLVPDVL